MTTTALVPQESLVDLLMAEGVDLETARALVAKWPARISPQLRALPLRRTDAYGRAQCLVDAIRTNRPLPRLIRDDSETYSGPHSRAKPSTVIEQQVTRFLRKHGAKRIAWCDDGDERLLWFEIPVGELARRVCYRIPAYRDERIQNAGYAALQDRVRSTFDLLTFGIAELVVEATGEANGSTGVGREPLVGISAHSLALQTSSARKRGAGETVPREPVPSD